MSKGRVHHIKMVSGTKHNVYTDKQFQLYKLAKSPLEMVSTQVSVQELEKMRKIANVNYAGIDNETILRNFITRVLDGKHRI